MKYPAIILFIIICTFSMATAQTLTGNWEGTIENPGQALPIKTEFHADGNKYSGTIHIQNVNLPLENIAVTDDSVHFEFAAGPGRATFKGSFRDDSTISGNYFQNEYKLPFSLERFEPEKEPEKISRAPLPYHHQDMIIKNGHIDIGGTLTWPENKTAKQLVIMISGSGAQDRDEAIPITDFKPFAKLADSLTMSGFATFRYDDRGIGKSTGRFPQATLDTLASDVKAIIDHFVQNGNHQFDTIVLLGHSQGGVVAGKVAAEDDLVDKLILMASTGITLKEVLRYQVRQAFEKGNIGEELITEEIDAREALMDAIKNDGPVPKAKEDYKQKFKTIQVAAGADSSQAETMSKQQANALVQGFGMPQMRSLLLYDPTADLRKLAIPVLALFGEKDTQVDPDLNMPPIQKALNEANTPHKIVVIDSANHLFQKADTGAVQEYATLESKFTDGFLSTIENWLKE